MASSSEGGQESRKAIMSFEDTDSFSSFKEPLLSYLHIAVPESEKRISEQISVKDHYVVYLIDTCLWKEDAPVSLEVSASVWRRYSEFELLRNYLLFCYPYIVVAPLPEKRASLGWQKPPDDPFDPDFIDRRRAGLENFLLRVAAHPVLSLDQVFLGFLQKESGWKDTASERDLFSRMDAWFKGLNAALRIQKPDPRFQEIKAYSQELQGNVGRILDVRGRLSEQLFGIHKYHQNYGRVLSEWSGLEGRLGDALQSMGHQMDNYSGWIDAALEEEEACMDQLKEYQLYSDALRSVVHKHDALLYQVEKASDDLHQKKKEKHDIANGKVSFFHRLLGSPPMSDSERESRLRAVDRLIEDNKDKEHQAITELESFQELSLMEVDRFHEQKARDVREILLKYINIQISICRKGMTTWKSVRDALDKA